MSPIIFRKIPGWSPSTFRGRLAVTFTILLVALFLVLWAAVYALVRSNLRHDLHHGIEMSLTAVERVVRTSPEHLAEFERNSTVEYFRVSQEGRGVIYRSEDWVDKRLDSGVSPEVAREAWITDGNWTWASGFDPERNFLLDSRFIEGLPGGTYEIIVAFDTEPITRTLSDLILALIAVIPVAVMLGSLGGYLMGRWVLAPVAAMAAKAGEITVDRLSERLPVENPEDELGRLATVINQTLGRLEASFEVLRRFTADASHELRTPLTAIQSVGEVALREAEPDGGVRREAVGSMLEEVDRLTRLVDGLLVLARGDAGTAQLRREPLDLFRLTREVVDLLHVLAEEKDQKLIVEGRHNLVVPADRTTLRHALLNLIENAIKYTPNQGTVRVQVGLDELRLRPFVAVTDSGPGIAREHFERVFDRFFRIAEDRSSSSTEGGGSGLGLAIARWAARANDADIELESTPGSGSCFTLTFAPGSLVTAEPPPAAHTPEAEPGRQVQNFQVSG